MCIMEHYYLHIGKKTYRWIGMVLCVPQFHLYILRCVAHREKIITFLYLHQGVLYMAARGGWFRHRVIESKAARGRALTLVCNPATQILLLYTLAIKFNVHNTKILYAYCLLVGWSWNFLVSACSVAFLQPRDEGNAEKHNTGFRSTRFKGFYCFILSLAYY